MTHIDTLEQMADNNTTDFTMDNAYKIYILQKWFSSWYQKSDITYMVELIYWLNEKEYTTYVFQKGGYKI